MKKTSLLTLSILMLCFAVTSAFAQSNNTSSKGNFVIHGANLNATDLNFYSKSIAVVDFEKYRARTTSVFLEFRNDFRLELISAEKLVQSGASLNISDYSDSLPKDYIYPIFRIDESGILVTMHRTKITKAQLNETSK